MAPHATMLNVAVTFDGELVSDRYGFVSIPPDSPGVVFHDDWDALGMRASASGSVSFHDVAVGAGALRDAFPAGAWSGAMLERYLLAGAFHASVSLGIAEAAHAGIVARLQARAEDCMGDPHVVAELAADVVDVAAMRGSFDRAARIIDAHHAAYLMGDPPEAASQAAFAEVQAAKAFLNAAAVRVVDRALALSGGAGYRAVDPLAKAWRDVRAGAFLHPLGANRAGVFLARTALGLPPV
jgi:alkylation response protein AidB-like acyl-CoA dehydrogenase